VFDLEVHQLRFRAEVTAPLRLPAARGAALRGALFAALRAQFCLAGGGPDCGRPPAAASCPVCFLLAPVDEGNRRGQDVPRPYVLRVALDGPPAYARGETFEFGLSTFGHSLGVFPYALLGVQEMGQRGLGAGRAGGFELAEVWAEQPLAGRQERIYRGGRGGDPHVGTPALPVDGADVAAEAATLGARGADRRLRLSLPTPLRLVEGRHLVKPESFQPRVLLARLLDRLDALGARYGGGPTAAGVAALLAHAATVRVVESRLTWRELFRASGRHRALLPMGGLVGDVVLEGDLTPLLPWLVWGSLVHVGKDAAMGNGELRLSVP
jgi:CRISPR-associated endoribonuclease Cas6